jgi:hypothetical protein
MSRLYERRLDRGVSDLQTVLEGGVLGAFEPVVGVGLEGRQLPDHCREVTGRVPCDGLRVLRA